MKDTFWSVDDPEDALLGIIRLQIDAAIKTREYFGGHGLQTDVSKRWQEWSRDCEALWTTAVTRAMEAEYSCGPTYASLRACCWEWRFGCRVGIARARGSPPRSSRMPPFS
ncbi:hypothetical protein ASG84_25000 [Rhodococcus sp. Leaf278]|nr:hypothetical protein ASG84_25000 [Rhodococcus sp. Leaf278]